MKKVIIILAIIASVWGSLQAQDTLWQKPAPLSNYFNNNWIDTSGTYVASPTWYGRPWITARQFVTEDTLQVYGIAAMMVPAFWNCPQSEVQTQLNLMFPEEPTYDNCNESLLLFQYQGNDTPVMQQLGDTMPVSYLNTPVTHYMMSYRPPLGMGDTIAKPIYERYFSEPQIVHDTFFAGYTQNHYAFNQKEGRWYWKRPPFSCLGFDHNCEGALWLTYEEELAICYKDSIDSTIFWWRFVRKDVGYALFIFPILTPEPEPVVDTTVTPGTDTTVTPGGDTTYYGGDTVAMGDTLVVTDTIVIGGDTIVTSDTILTVREHDMLWNLTVVSPNPARGVAKVVASPGLTRVEAFNAAGTKLLDSPATGFSLSIDVSAWPSGTYLLRIHTPVGVTVRKLLVNGR